jgi:hypothetical protein
LLADDPEFSPPDLDRCSWPNGEAMNGAEIDLMADRLGLFARRGLSREPAERLADTLVRRDRCADDRRVCLECTNLRGRSCAEPVGAGLGRNVEQFALILQRCPSFRAVGSP